jgi:8-oxo-dGTP pyrophosphatase MutT (NUDIX family)
MTPEDIERMNAFIDTTSYDTEPTEAEVEAVGNEDEDAPVKPAAGVLYCIEGGRVLLCLRSGKDGEDAVWSFPAGSIEEGEDAPQAARREFLEEMQHDVGDLSAAPCVSFVNHQGTPFTCFYVEGPQFTPRLDDEHLAFCWSGSDFIPTPAHPGVLTTFAAFDKMFAAPDCNCN